MKQRTKEAILTGITVLLYIAAMAVNIAMVINKPVSGWNFTISVFFFLCWCVFLFSVREGHGILTYSFVFWCGVLLAAVLAIASNVSKITLSVVNLVFLVFGTPMFGFRYLIRDTLINLIVLAVIAAAFSIISYLKLRRKRR